MRYTSSGKTTAVWTGRFGDGKSASSSTVEVRLGERGIMIRHPSATTDLVWPYGALATAAPISPRSRDVLVTYSFQPGATLFVADGGFAAALVEAAPTLSTSAVRWRHARPWIWAAAAVAIVAAGVWLAGLSPTRAIAGLLPDTARQSLGEQVVRSMTQGKRACEAPAGRLALDKLAARLTAAAGPGARFRIVVSDWGLVNAFAAPGEQIVLTGGLIAKAESADEVAGVLAHEMGHGIERHPEAGVIRVIGLTAAAELLLGGSAGSLTNVSILLAQLSYTRGAEVEADTHALRILRGAAIAPTGLAAFFRRMMAGEAGDKAAQAGFFSTHPATAERVRLVESQSPYAATPALTEAEWRALKAICQR